MDEEVSKYKIIGHQNRVRDDSGVVSRLEGLKYNLRKRVCPSTYQKTCKKICLYPIQNKGG
jgi:hypothetical protein